jgi:hypothetical protein
MARVARSLRVGALVPVALLALRAGPVWACSVCLAGDPSFSTHGSSAQGAGDVSVYLEMRGWSKKSGLLAHDDEDPAEGAHAKSGRGSVGGGGHAGHGSEGGGGHAGHGPSPGEDEGHGGEEENVGRRLDLYLAWSPFDRATFTVNVPWAWNQIEETHHDGRRYTSLSGLGDVSLAASGVVWRNRDVLPSTWVEARGWLKAPTGPSKQREEGVADPHLQTGTGSWDFGFGAAAAHRLSWGSLYASGFYRVNTEGSLDYEYGDVVLATAALEVPLGHALGRESLARFTPGFALDFRWAERDRAGGRDYEDSGGAILYATPSLRIQLPAFGERQRAWLRTAVQIPTSDEWLDGEQDEETVWSVGVGYGF